MNRPRAVATSQNGVVIFVVLATLAILGILCLQTALNARDQINRARTLVERAEANLALRSAEAEVSLALLTRPWVVGRINGGDCCSAYWNFEGKPFRAAGVEVELQDLSGMFVMPQPGYNSAIGMLETLLDRLGVDHQRATSITNQLLERQGVPRELPLQDIGELSALGGGLTRQELFRLRRLATTYPLTNFNPATSPPEVLGLIYRGSALEAVLALRSRGELTAGSLAAVTRGDGSDLSGFGAGPAFRITIRAKRGDVQVARESVRVFDAYGAIPIRLWSMRPLLSHQAVAAQ